MWPPEGALRIWYDRYFQIYRDNVTVNTVGWLPPKIMGMSFEGLLAFLRGVPGPDHSIMDAGAGISTWVLRKTFHNVVSVEPADMHHIGKVIDALCRKYGAIETRQQADHETLQEAERLVADGKAGEADALMDVAPEVAEQNHRMAYGWDGVPICDYVLYDYDKWERRLWSLPDAWARTRIAMYVDDADDRPANIAYLEAVKRFAESERATVTECREAIDVHGRWGVWLHREAPVGGNGQ